MLDLALSFAAKALNNYLTLRTGSSLGEVVVTRLVDEGGKWAIPDGKLGLTLVNIEEERVFKSQSRDTTFVDGRHVVLEPDLKLNLTVVLAANFTKHEEALRYLSHALTFFQSKPIFTPSDSPDLDPRFEQLTVELLSMSFEQLNQIWAFIGCKQLPSVFYRLRMVVLQDSEVRGISAPITRIDTGVHS